MPKPLFLSSLLLVSAGCGGDRSASLRIVETPKNLIVLPGDPAEFTVVAAGHGLTYQWWHGGTRIEGATRPTYRIDAVSAADYGDYTVEAFQGGFREGASVQLTETGAPTILAESRGEPVGGEVTMSVIAQGEPAPTYQWVVEIGTALPVPVPGGTGPSLTVPVPAHGGVSYWVYVTNPKGSAIGSPNLVQAP